VTVNARPEDRELVLAPLDEMVDHVRGAPAGRLIIEYGDYECPYSRQAFHAIFDRDRAGTAVAGRIRRDVASGLASGQVLGTPTLFIDGVVYRGGYDPPALLAALAAKAVMRSRGAH
jgi:protein-disulfide isomerase